MSLHPTRLPLRARGIDPATECRPDPARIRALADAAAEAGLTAVADAARRVANDLDAQPGAGSG